MARVAELLVKPICLAWWYVLPLESVNVNTCELELPPRMQTPIQFPAVFALGKASEALVPEVSLLACCTRGIVRAGLNAAIPAAQFVETLSVALADAAPAVVWIWSSAISLVLGAAGTLSRIA